MNSNKNIFAENNEKHQLILHLHQYIFHSKWTWIDYFGGQHEVCLARGDSSSGLPKHVKQQWDYIEKYLEFCKRGNDINPEKSLQEIVNYGVTASRQKEKPRRHPTTDWYYLIFSKYKASGEDLSILQRELNTNHHYRI